jgi:hypothetical protein
MTDTDQKALEAFLLDNPELGQLEALLDEFNIFEAVGAAFAQQLLLTAALRGSS